MFYKVCIPALPVRSAPADSAEMVNQLLFGEQVKIVQKDKQWLQIISWHDGYQGWVDEKGIIQTGEGDRHAVLASVFGLAKHRNQTIHLPCGSLLPDFNTQDQTFELAGESYTLISGEVISDGVALAKEALIKQAAQWLNAPYLWGGRNIMGVDCSGLTQVLFRLAGIDLPRDASQQVKQGFDIPFVQETKALDLAFFGDEENKITHVGVLLSNQQIMHASGKVRIDAFDQQGIYNAEKGKYTHTLRVIKRFVHE